MRIITQKAVEKFFNREEFILSNTNIRVNNWKVLFYLHNNKIAELENWILTIYDWGYQSNTTKERLNWILRYNNLWYIKQKNFVWYHIDKNWVESEFKSWIKIQI